MAVYTDVSFSQATELLHSLGLGELLHLQGIQGGIENSNYFATCGLEGESGVWVLTVFERLGFDELPYYLRLMQHLAACGIPVPTPAANAEGALVHTLHHKPAAVVSKLLGTSELRPTADHCAQVGAMLARMHLAGSGFDLEQPNLRALPWWNQTVPEVLPHLGQEEAALLTSELAYQNHVAAQPAFAALPRGPVHADLFRDNVMFENGQLSGFFDFYFAGQDSFLFDLAVCLNDWCVQHSQDAQDGSPQPALAQAFLGAYQTVRPLTAPERQLLPALLRAGALRFWLSRLWDWHLPREAALLKPHDPTHFERVLKHRLATPEQVQALLTPTGVEHGLTKEPSEWV